MQALSFFRVSKITLNNTDCLAGVLSVSYPMLNGHSMAGDDRLMAHMRPMRLPSRELRPYRKAHDRVRPISAGHGLLAEGPLSSKKQSSQRIN